MPWDASARRSGMNNDKFKFCIDHENRLGTFARNNRIGLRMKNIIVIKQQIFKNSAVPDEIKHLVVWYERLGRKNPERPYYMVKTLSKDNYARTTGQDRMQRLRSGQEVAKTILTSC